MTWHRPVRIAVGLAACATAVGAYYTISARPPAARLPPIERSDPASMLESQAAVLQQVQESEERFEVRADKTLHYEDGSTRQFGVRISVRNRNGRDFLVTADEARAAQGGQLIELSGRVVLGATDGFELRTEKAMHDRDTGLVSTPGQVSFVKGRLAGSAVGMTYDTAAELLSLLASPDVRLSADPEAEGGAEGLQFRSGSATLDRIQHLLTLDAKATVQRGTQTLSGDRIVARLAEDEQRVTLVELRGHAGVTGGSGALGSMAARDMDLDYGEDGETLDRAVLVGGARAEFGASISGGRVRRFEGGVLDLDIADDGTLAGAAGRDGIRVQLPAGDGQPASTITAKAFETSHGPAGTLLGLQASEDVQFQEERPGGALRTVKGRALRIRLADDRLQSAVFDGGASFADGTLTASGAEIRYDVVAGRLLLQAGPPAGAAQMTDSRLTLTAARLDVALQDQDLEASGAVKTVVRPGTGERTSGAERLPGLLRAAQVVNVNADRLSVSRGGTQMAYTGSAMLWQGDTAMRADVITMDRQSGDLAAVGAARLTLPLADGLATGRADRIDFDDATRIVTLETPPPAPSGKGVPPAAAGAVVGPAAKTAAPGAVAVQSYLSAAHGEVRADRIDVVLGADASTTERLEARGEVSLRVGAKSGTSQRLVYFAKDQRYELAGSAVKPVRVVESCRETTGRTLVFYRSTDRILVDGNEEMRTKTSGGASCVPAAR